MVSSVSRGGVPGLAIPVLSPTRPYVDEQLRLTVWRLPAAAARAVLHAPLTFANAQRRFGAMPGTLIRRAEVSATAVYRQLLPQLHSPSTSNSGLISSIWRPGPVGYTVLHDGLLRPRTVTNPGSIWANPLYQNGYLPAPLASADVRSKMGRQSRGTS